MWLSYLKSIVIWSLIWSVFLIIIVIQFVVKMLLKVKLGLIKEWEDEEPESEYLNIEKLKRGDIPYLVVTTIFSIVFIGLVSSNTIYFTPIEKYSVEDLSDPLSRIGFVWKHYAPAIYLLISCGTCYYITLHCCISLANIHLSGNWIWNIHYIVITSIILLTLSFCFQLVIVLSCPQFNAELTLKYVPAIHSLFNLGVSTIWLGPRLYWNLGFTFTIVPTLSTSLYIVIVENCRILYMLSTRGVHATLL